MKLYTPQWIAALEAGDAVSHGALKIEPSGFPPLRIWGGYGDITLDGEDYVGVGDRGLVSVTGGQLGSSEQGISATLSGVDPDQAINIMAARRAPVLVWRLGFDGSGRNLLDATRFDRGRIQDLSREETPGGEAEISISVEGAVRGLGRRGSRMRSDADQRLINPGDAGMKAVASVAAKNLYWGGSKPVRAATAIAGMAGDYSVIGQVITRGPLLSRLF